MKKLSGTVGIIGAGVMGQAIARALIDSRMATADRIWAVTKRKETAAHVQKLLGIRSCNSGWQKEISKTDLIILAVKPAQVPEALRALALQKSKRAPLVISVVTGVPTSSLERGLGAGARVIRAITNTPCVVGAGMTALCRGSKVDQGSLDVARTIFEKVGRCIELDESLCDAMTGLSACGPAYIYLIIEALADGGVRVGLPRDLAFQIVAQTVLGSAKMVQESGRHPASLRDDVTTPAGCTIGALLVMEDGRLRSTLARAVEEATRIAKELGSLKN